MKLTIELAAGPSGLSMLTKRAMKKNIDAQLRSIERKPLACDDILLVDTLSILTGIYEQLPE